MNNVKDIILIFALLVISIVDSWGACTSYTAYQYDGSSMSGPDYQCKMNISLSWAIGSAERPCISGEMHGCSVSGTAATSTTIIKSCYYENTANRVRVEFLQCGSQNEADSLVCVNDGKIWDRDPITGVTSCVEEVSCNWTVSTIPRLRCLDVPASGSIVCKNGECSGLPYSMWWSELRIDSTSTRCGNISHVHTSDTSYTFGSQCDVDERCSDEKKCYSEGGTFYIVQECAVGRPVVGNDGVSEKIVPYIVSTGKGSCSEMGYRNNNYQNSGGGVGNSNAIGGNPPPIDDECLVYGINCPEPDTTDYQQPPNQNPSKCFCEPYDGLGSMSKVTCPDGTVSIYYFSCLEWQHLFVSSSSNAPQSSAIPRDAR